MESNKVLRRKTSRERSQMRLIASAHRIVLQLKLDFRGLNGLVVKLVHHSWMGDSRSKAVLARLGTSKHSHFLTTAIK